MKVWARVRAKVRVGEGEGGARMRLGVRVRAKVRVCEGEG